MYGRMFLKQFSNVIFEKPYFYKISNIHLKDTTFFIRKNVFLFNEITAIVNAFQIVLWNGRGGFDTTGQINWICMRGHT